MLTRGSCADQELAYNVAGTVDTRGEQLGGPRSSGSTGSLQGAMAVKCVQANASMGLFVMNMFNVNVAVSQGPAAPLQWQRAAPGNALTGDEPLGYDVYFYQTSDGAIPVVEYQSNDPPFYVNVKLAAINAFQTQLRSGAAIVNDPTGVHSAAFVAQALTVNATFTQANYVTFMDPTVTAQKVLVTARASVSFHPTDGSAVYAENRQHVILARDQNAAAAHQNGGSGAGDESGYAMFMSSVGVLSATLDTAQVSRRFATKGAKNATTAPLIAASLVEAARHAHAAIARTQAAQVAQTLPQLLRSEAHNDVVFTRVLPHVCTRVVGAALRRARALPLAMAQRNRLASLLAAHQRCTVTAPAPVAQVRAGPSLPFNRSGSASATLGGHAMGVQFGAAYLVGTNLNCHNAAFAYEVSASLDASIWLFGESAPALGAAIVYGQNGPLPLADSTTVTVWGKPYWNRSIPALQYCVSESLPIGATSPRGISLSHTLWVSIVPVTFVAQADLSLALSWQYDICTDNLSASVSVTPGATVTFGGSAQVDLLVLRAGVALNGNVAADVVPRADVAGTQCEAGVQVALVKKGMSGALQG